MWIMILIFLMDGDITSQQIPGYKTSEQCGKELTRQESISNISRYKLTGTCVYRPINLGLGIK